MPYEGEFKKVDGFPIIFKEMPLAKQWCVGNGVEIGAAAHNPFGLEGSLNLAPKSYSQDWEHYKRTQAEMCGSYADVDIDAVADSLKLSRMKLDYIIHSHVLEHLPNPLKAMDVWYRALNPNGILFMIVPKRDALPQDAERPVTPLETLIEWREKRLNIETFDWAGLGINHMGHASVWTLESLLDMVMWCNDHLEHTWNIVDTEETDSKVGNGYTIILEKI
jgi:SAM-dependent methyltransferase